MVSAPLAERPAHVPEDRVVAFDFYNPPNLEEGFQEAWKTLQAPGCPSLVWTPFNGGHWIATRGPQITQVFSDFEHFSSRVVVVPKAVGEIHKMLPTTLDPPQHRPFRKLLNNNLSPVAVKRLEDKIRAATIALVEQLEPLGECEFIADFAAQLPIQIFMHMVELPVEDAPKLKYWTDQVVKPNGEIPYDEALSRYHAYLEPFVRERLGGSGTDVITDIINRDVDGRPLTMPEILSLLTQLMMGGLDTVYNFIGYAFLFLAGSPDHRRQLIDEPSLIPAAVNELLRRFPLVSMAREIREDFEWDGVELKKGEMIVAPSPLVGVDERLNPDPLRVDFRRKGGEHATFGKGHHICPGANLASLEMRIILAEWLKRIPDFDVKPGADIRYLGGIVGALSSLPLIWGQSQISKAK